MAWYSLIPVDSEYHYLETFLIKCFITFGVLIGGPGWSLVVYDFIVYCYRIVVYELLPRVTRREDGSEGSELVPVTCKEGPFSERMNEKSSLLLCNEGGELLEEKEVAVVDQEERNITTSGSGEGE